MLPDDLQGTYVPIEGDNKLQTIRTEPAIQRIKSDLKQSRTPTEDSKELKEFLKKEKLHLHMHNEDVHVHEHYHGPDNSVLVSTIGLVIHSIADGLALGASLFCKS